MNDQDREILLDHATHPRNFGPLAQANRTVEGNNPLCGDRIRVSLRIGPEVIEQAAFEGTACAMCTASASLMCEIVAGMAIERAGRLIEQFRSAMTERPAGPLPGGLDVLLPVQRFPMRIKCVMLPWHALRAAMEGQSSTVTTE